MKNIYKTFALVAITVLTGVTTVTAQNRSSKKENTSKVVIRKESIKRVPSAKVTYKTPKRKVVTVRTLPNKSNIKYNNQNYYYANNKYYSYSQGHYVNIMPKVGFRIAVLPSNFNRIKFQNHQYFQSQGVFYSQNGSDYEVVNPEIGTLIYELPSDYERVTIDGQTYYEYGNILYEKVQNNGARAYEVVGFIDGN